MCVCVCVFMCINSVEGYMMWSRWKLMCFTDKSQLFKIKNNYILGHTLRNGSTALLSTCIRVHMCIRVHIVMYNCMYVLCTL